MVDNSAGTISVAAYFPSSSPPADHVSVPLGVCLPLRGLLLAFAATCAALASVWRIGAEQPGAEAHRGIDLRLAE